MAEKKPARKGAQKSAKRTSTKSKGFTAEERAAMRERVQELKAEARREDRERALLARIPFALAAYAVARQGKRRSSPARARTATSCLLPCTENLTHPHA
jgi:hypothetical protein